MKIAITGATGFIGQNLVEYLQERGLHNMIKIGRLSGSGEENRISISSFLQNPTEKYDVLIHLAGKAHDLKKTADAEEYFTVNYELTRKIFEHFKASQAKIFIYISSVKAVTDLPTDIVTEDVDPEPATPYGQSKLKAENYLLSQSQHTSKKIYILRPCMVHGPGNKGNLNLLVKLVKMNIPYPLGVFRNKRSFLSIENFCFTVYEIITGDISCGIYNVADTESLSTNELIKIISNTFNKQPKIWRINKKIIILLSRLGDWLNLPFNSESLQKLATDYVVSNNKLIAAMGKPLPTSVREGLIKTIKSFR